MNVNLASINSYKPKYTIEKACSNLNNARHQATSNKKQLQESRVGMQNSSIRGKNTDGIRETKRNRLANCKKLHSLTNTRSKILQY